MLAAIWRRWLRRVWAKPPRRDRLRTRPSLEALESRDLLSSSWANFGGNPQHTEISTVASQTMDSIHWQTSIDLQPWGSEHYGEPVFTPANTVIVPVKTGSNGNFNLEGINGATGTILWTVTTDYQEPPYTWLPPFQAVYDPTTDRAYFAGDGGTVYYINNPDSPAATISGQLAFYGLANYQANKSAYNASVQIDTPFLYHRRLPAMSIAASW